MYNDKHNGEHNKQNINDGTLKLHLPKIITIKPTDQKLYNTILISAKEGIRETDRQTT